MPPPPIERTRRAEVRLESLVLVVALTAASAWLLPVRAWLEAALAWTRQAGTAGFAAYFALFVVAAVLMVPKAILVFGAGWAFGAVEGLGLGLAASVSAAAVAFALGRTLGRSYVRARLAADRRWDAVDEAVGKDGFGIVLLLRLSPLFPYGLINYALGLTRVRTRDFVLASALGMIPINALYAWMGSAAPTVADAVQGRAELAGWKWTAGVVGLVAAAGAVLLVARAARRGLDKALEVERDGT